MAAGPGAGGGGQGPRSGGQGGGGGWDSGSCVRVSAPRVSACVCRTRWGPSTRPDPTRPDPTPMAFEHPPTRNPNPILSSSSGAARAAGAESGGARQDAHPGACKGIRTHVLKFLFTTRSNRHHDHPNTYHHPNPQNIVAASSKISEQEALYHARLTPITDRLVGMAFPDPLDAVARLIAGRYQVGICVCVVFLK